MIDNLARCRVHFADELAAQEYQCEQCVQDGGLPVDEYRITKDQGCPTCDQEDCQRNEVHALESVLGYTCFNDGSVRDWQEHSTHFTAGKNFLGSGACGPWIVTADEIPDPAGLALQTRVNGETWQRAPVSDLVFSVPYLVSYISTFTELLPGDIIATGTPSGVGAWRKPAYWLKDGDEVEVDISGIGILRNRVAHSA